MESKHEIEEYFFNKLKELYPKLPVGNISKPEPPDYVISTGTETIAIEITQIHNEKGTNEKFPPAQKHATEDSILENAQILFSLRNGIPLHMSFSFANHINLNEKQRQALSIQICEIVEFEIQGREFDKHFSFCLGENLPKELLRVSGYYSPNVTGVSWYSAKGRLVPNLTKREILHVIGKKEKKIKDYINKVDKAILVIAEGLIPNSWFDGVEAIEQHEILTTFDKVFIIRYLSNQIIEIK